MQVYFAGELFSFKHLIGNAALANSIHLKSDGRYQCILPQSLEQRDTTPHKIRDQDIKTLLSCDVALFNFDGTEIDSGTVVEFMICKFLDIPAVIIRSDFRNGGDGSDPWNLMISFYPRTEVILVDSIKEYQDNLLRINSNPFSIADGKNDNLEVIANRSITANIMAMDNLADKIISDFDKLVKTKSVIPEELCQTVYDWVAKASGFEKKISSKTLAEIIQRKKELGLLKNGN